MRQAQIDNIFISMTPDQSAMARAALHLSRAELATLAGLGVATVVRFESGQSVTDDSIVAMRAALEKAGVEFIPAGAAIRDSGGAGGPGVRLRG
ncbi:helix-turn-helix domain-containing protein [Sphingomonas sp. MMSM20]|uniref:helix-turn-helix domain-containing protein n=1 Tax=Sphingomonas lycopersici TaxID=2951807 RepID=UPI0022373A10|nr:helix-turn-helix domain-containing protein [Sphingomonas lycopersici]MCW6529735.1 helix-turn-helix domain-containing protein [Sphingomonas lycopersici]